MKKQLFPMTHYIKKYMPRKFLMSSNRRGESSKNAFEGNFREIIWPILVAGQIFGVMPVIGIKSRSSSDVHFKWTSLRTFHSLFVVIILASYTLLIVWKLFDKHIEFSSIAFLIFYLSHTCAFGIFFGLASKFPNLMRYWEKAESKLPTFRNKRQKRKYLLKIRSIAFTILILALFEHIVSIVTLLHFVIICEKEKDPIDELMRMQATYACFSNQILNFICGKFINISATFIWSYLDVFIMTLSLGISMHIKLYNEEMKRAKGEHKSIDFWIYRRMQYGKLRDLVTTVDEHIEQPLPTFYRVLYYWISLFFLLLRTFTVAFFASCINDELKETIKILNAIPTYSWNTETKRFFNEIQGENIGLSGMKFFVVTGGLILGLAGTIATYVLVLLQFASSDTQVSYCDDPMPAVNKNRCNISDDN